MANRPVFAATKEGSSMHCLQFHTEFQFYSGFSLQQKQRCIRSLHEAYLKDHPDQRLLEISSKSENPLGISLSAFHLMYPLKDGSAVPVETAFQSSKTFEGGGPYLDLLAAAPRDAKRDERLKTSGPLTAFTFEGDVFPTEPKTFFYHWLYLNALRANPDLACQLIQYDAFTDIEFNPQRSLNCQAEAAAIYVSLYRKGLLDKALQDKDWFLHIIYGTLQ